MPADAMTTDAVRGVLVEIRIGSESVAALTRQRDDWSPDSLAEQYAARFDRHAAALTHALAALDAVERVRAVVRAAEVACDPETTQLSDHERQRVMEVADDVRRALDGEAAHG